MTKLSIFVWWHVKYISPGSYGFSTHLYMVALLPADGRQLGLTCGDLKRMPWPLLVLVLLSAAVAAGFPGRISNKRVLKYLSVPCVMTLYSAHHVYVCALSMCFTCVVMQLATKCVPPHTLWTC